MSGSTGDQSDIERRKLEIEAEKLAIERSFAKKWFPTMLTGVIAFATVLINGTQIYIAHQERAKSDEQARVFAEADQRQQDGQWGISVLELYITHPEGFDPSKSPVTAKQNLTALAVSAPDIMRPILQQRMDDIVRSPAGLNTESLTAIASALGTGSTTDSGTDNLASLLPGWPQGANPADYSVYIQYGANSAAVATAFAQRLRDQHFRVPDLELVNQSTTTSEVRYYRPEQKPVADALASSLGNGAISKFIGAGQNLPGGIIEVWIPASS